jgi:hypothetical protein
MDFLMLAAFGLRNFTMDFLILVAFSEETHEGQDWFRQEEILSKYNLC